MGLFLRVVLRHQMRCDLCGNIITTMFISHFMPPMAAKLIELMLQGWPSQPSYGLLYVRVNEFMTKCK